jgi:glycerol kinase
MIDSAREVEKMASTVTDDGECYIDPAINGLFAPHWRSDARGVIVGLSGGTSRGHIARATLEAVAFQSRELLDAMAKDARHVLDKSVVKGNDLKVDGGMTPNKLLMQFQADITGRRVVRPVVAETTALGAAYAAGLATGFWSGLDELKAQWKVDMVFSPAMPQETVRALAHNWDRAVSRTLGWAKSVQSTAKEDELLPPPSREGEFGSSAAAAGGASSGASSLFGLVDLKVAAALVGGYLLGAGVTCLFRGRRV